MSLREQDDRRSVRELIQSGYQLLTVDSVEEQSVINLFNWVATALNRPLFVWSITAGFARADREMGSQKFNRKPEDALAQIRSTTSPGIYLFLDFQPYLDDPVIVRMLKELSQSRDPNGHTICLVGTQIDLPAGLQSFSAHFSPELPQIDEIQFIVRREAEAYVARNSGQKVRTNQELLGLLVSHLRGLTAADVQRLAHQAVFNDGVIDQSDIARVVEAKRQLLETASAIRFDFDGVELSELAGLSKLKHWLELRRSVFLGSETGLDRPKGLLLVGVQGGGKSFAAKAIAGSWGVPLLHLDMGSLYNKFFGETEKNLRKSLRTAEVMAPCVLWVDEIEKALSQNDHENGTAQRVLGTLLTWMAENERPVFVVATANDIEKLPPELIRKGRLDEIFFVDLPTEMVRREILKIHLKKRQLPADEIDISSLASISDGFSGAELEQAIAAGSYAARALSRPIETADIKVAILSTKPLSVVMKHRVDALRAWAKSRTVSAHG